MSYHRIHTYVTPDTTVEVWLTFQCIPAFETSVWTVGALSGVVAVSLASPSPPPSAASATAMPPPPPELLVALPQTNDGSWHGQYVGPGGKEQVKLTQ